VAIGGQEGPWSLQFFRNRRIFGHFNVSLENFRTFAAGKDEDFEFHRKIFELGSAYYMGATTPLFIIPFGFQARIKILADIS